MRRLIRHLASHLRKHFFRRRLRGNFLQTKLPVVSPVLSDLFRRADLKALDVGARRGPLWHFEALAGFTHLFLSEPDRVEADALERAFARSGPWRRVTVMREALGSGRGEATLFVTRQPGLSSLLKPARELLRQFYPARSEKKFILADWDVVAETRVPVITLDAAARQYGSEGLAFLKLDTQGTELDILRSGREEVLPGVVAIYVEIEFVPLYEDQPLFAEVHRFIEAEGFRIVDLQRSSLRRRSAPQSVYSKREIIYAHALYFREQNRGASPLTEIQKVRLMAAAVAFEYFDRGLVLAEELGLGSAAREIVEYAGRLRSFIEKGSDLGERGRLVADLFTDRSYER